MDTHPNIPDLSLLHKRVWGSDSKRSSICGFCQLSKSTCCQYQIERAKILFPLISPQVITGWGEDLINLNLERKKDCYWNYTVVFHPYYSHMMKTNDLKKTKGKRENWCHVKWPKTVNESLIYTHYVDISLPCNVNKRNKTNRLQETPVMWGSV